MDPVRLKVPLAGSNSSADASELSPLVVVALAERLDEPKLATLD